MSLLSSPTSKCACTDDGSRVTPILREFNPSDWASCVAELLVGRDLDALISVNRDWASTALALKASLHRVTASDLQNQMPSPSAMRNLDSVDLQEYSSQARGGDNAVAWLRRLVACPKKMRHILSLRIGQLLPVALRDTFLRCSPALHTLSLACCEKVTDGTLQLIPAAALRSIDLSGCWRITDAGLVTLARRSPRMERAILDRLNRITSTGVEIMVAEWPALSTLALSASRYMGTDCLHALINAASIERLHIGSLELDNDEWKRLLDTVASRFGRTNVGMSPDDGASARGLVPLHRLVFSGLVGLVPAALERFIWSIRSQLTDRHASSPACPAIDADVGGASDTATYVCTDRPCTPTVEVSWSLADGTDRVSCGSLSTGTTSKSPIIPLTISVSGTCPTA